ncbi:hypothetical protein FB451DRAFT_1441318 [Mycena latifolia]|nr:hypothetical protein FB451DRAFT_1441318 [Mycena latifolia]
MILEEREEREAVEDDLNAAWDKLAAALIELQQKEDELEMKIAEINDLVAEHERIVAIHEEVRVRIHGSAPQHLRARGQYRRSAEAALAHLEEETNEASSGEIHAHRGRQEELAWHVEDLVAQLHTERAATAQAATAKGHAGALRAEHCILNTKESVLQRVLADLAFTQALLATHDPDLAAVQAAF